MPATDHTFLGSVQAIQYSGTNAAEIQAILGSSWTVYTNTVTATIAPCRPGGEITGINANLMHPTDWLVSQPAYGNTTPALSGGFSVVPSATFSQQYSA